MARWVGLARRRPPTTPAGHEVHPATLTWLWDRVHLARPEIGLDVHIADVLGLLDAEQLEQAVPVGHSYAGIVLTAVADRPPSGSTPSSGSIAHPFRTEPRSSLRFDPNCARQERDVRERGDGWRWPVVDRETLAHGLFGTAAGLDEAQLRTIVDRATPQRYTTFTSPLHLTGSGPPPYRRAMIVCTRRGMTTTGLRELIRPVRPALRRARRAWTSALASPESESAT